MGDPGGIGGEIILKALESFGRRTIPVIIGEASVFKRLVPDLTGKRSFPLKGFGEGRIGDAEILDLGLVRKPQFGQTNPEYGNASYAYIMKALNLLSHGAVSALVTCAISKKSIRMAGIDFPGHTELLADFAGVTDYVMMMAARALRVSLVTIHIPLRDVPEKASPSQIKMCIRVTDEALRHRFGFQKPSIKVCGLNPHAGEQGVIGTEDQMISDVLEEVRRSGVNVEGPFPADSLFHNIDADAYIAMYHDQGLVAVKTYDFRRTVNITLGLPFIRTSVGHGTGFDIAGKGLADPKSLIEAYRVAERMALGQRKTLNSKGEIKEKGGR
ncbi:MAG TPA: 4-hydroxythreonine-4-phosphate dehydrogenase PdxA [Deltaproteobacteria bacterium]|nr:4-hydroxythreonine-4-phosphate dehydrogenase PdxA [Deltaproteobacteria bacterium]